MSKDTSKSFGFPLISAKEMIETSTHERVCFRNLLVLELESETVDYKKLEVLCDGLSISNKVVAEITRTVETSAIVKDKDDTEMLMLTKEDIMIFETIVLSRHYLLGDLAEHYNLSVALH